MSRKDEFVHRMETLRSSFEAKLGERLDELETVIGGLDMGKSSGEMKKSLENLHMLSHKLRGGAGTFGFSHVASIAQELEQLSVDGLKDIEATTPVKFLDIKNLIKSLRVIHDIGNQSTFIEEASWQIVLEELGTRKVVDNTIFLVDDDLSLAQVLEEQLTHFGFSVKIITDISDLSREVSVHPPAAIVMDIMFPGKEDAGVLAIQELKQKGLLSCPVIFLSVRNDFKARLGAVKAGCDGYLVKPVDIIELVDTLNRLTTMPEEFAYRVVVVDDDSDVADRNALLLNEAGMEAKVVTDPMNVLATIREIDPDAILMDINMPECNGFELASVIRQDKKYTQIPIIFLTAEGGLERQYKAMRSGADEFLNKSAEPEFLVASVLARAERSRNFNALISRLKENETRFRAVAQTAVDAIVSVDQKGRIIFWNSAAKSIFGYESSEILGKPFTLIIAESSHAKLGASFQQVKINDGKILVGNTAEMEGRRKDNSKVPIEISLAEWSLGEGTFLSAIIRDITDRKEAEAEILQLNKDLENRVADRTEELRESEEGLMLSQRIAKLGNWTWNIESNGLKWSDQIYRIFGYRPQEFEATYEQFIKHVHPEDRERLEQNIAASLKRDAPYSLEHRIVKNDGSIRIVQETGFVERDAAGRAMRMIGNVQDITERKQAEQELQKSEEQVRILLDSTAEAIFGIDNQGRCTLVNPACLKMLGYDDAGEVHGKNMHDLIHHSREDGHPYPMEDCPISRAFRTGEPVHVEDEVLWRKDGSSFDAEYWSHPIVRESEVVGAVVTFIDITNRKKTEKELRQAQKMEAIGQLTGGVAHDFNNLLQIIRGYSQIAQSRVDKEDKISSDLDKVLHATERAGDLTRQLLAFSRQQVHQPRDLDVNHMVQSLVNMLGRVIGENIELKLLLGEELNPIFADPGMMEQVLLNLCLNARDSMPDGGTLTLNTEPLKADNAFCKVNHWATPGEYVVISVSDTGIGMSPEVREKIFDPFFTTKDVGKGTGLGLSTAYGIVEQHGGHILAYSEEGIGTSLKIYLPASKGATSEIGEVVQEEVPGGSETVLIAEDEEVVLMLVVTLLESKGYTVLTASNGIEAMDVLAKNSGRIDMVLLDVVMPKLSGREVYEGIKAIAPGLPIVFSTGYAANILDPEFVTNNKINLIRKPYSPNDLFRVIREVLD